MLDGGVNSKVPGHRHQGVERTSRTASRAHPFRWRGILRACVLHSDSLRLAGPRVQPRRSYQETATRVTLTESDEKRNRRFMKHGMLNGQANVAARKWCASVVT